MTLEALARMPGPARFVAAVEEAAATNPVVVVVFPDHAVTDGTADQILDELSATITSSCGLECADDVFPVRVLASFGARGAELTDYDDWDTIINWTGWHGQTVIVPAWEHPDVSDIINRWIPQPRASTLAPDRIPTLLIATSLEYTDRLVIDRLDPTVVSVHWWWGVFDRLDTELQLSTVTVSRPVGDLVAVAVMVELSGWDLSFLHNLVDNWDRRTDSAAGVVGQWRQSRESIDSAVAGQWVHYPGEPLPTSPPPPIQDAWRTGRIDRWGHHIRWAPHAIDEAEVHRRLWLAHNRALIGHVDEERTHFEKTIRDMISDTDLATLDDPSSEIIEIGSLYWLSHKASVRLSHEQKRRLRHFRDLRNALAHQTPLNDVQLDATRTYLAF
ncbi:hypothetical protein [Gordonia sp. (in: high G+C Gram-positive bacteria)]|uniref:hypothetical protein n=1 Tax=Gordonia sp. (in: high G+C Gram-positive bacteria) TaxID=84139 RepID=UPI001D95745E|nr:hypothetical protein [Gordonia sp. (in: high G+C Gram-positive bacteria)]MCB1293334.1 hypothetical protein [Gordonia sp. (in: high G+C Gram-positive bacteria)]HMS73941.1 hypothetical protein [Gordonia sp. (in: high G+C Gram-positive bacteria)]